MAALITPEQLIVYLNLPDDTQPTDTVTQVVDLVIDAMTEVAGFTLTDPYPAGMRGIALIAAARLYDNPLAMRSQQVADTTVTYAGDVYSVLTADEITRIGRAYGASPGAPVYSFPAWDWQWTVDPTFTTWVNG